MATAYLIGFLETNASRPYYKGLGIFSELSPTMSCTMMPFVILQVTATTYAEAVAELYLKIAVPPYKWALNELCRYPREFDRASEALRQIGERYEK